MNDDATEAAIQEKGLTAPRITPEHIEQTIASVKYHQFENTTITICAIILKNGYSVIGESACVSMDNFDADLGREIAFENAKGKICALEGYLLRDQLNQERILKEGQAQVTQFDE
jgi:hypothetical protein